MAFRQKNNRRKLPNVMQRLQQTQIGKIKNILRVLKGIIPNLLKLAEKVNNFKSAVKPVIDGYSIQTLGLSMNDM